MLLNTGTHFGGSFSASPPPIGLGSQQPVPRRGPLATPSSTISRSLDAASTIDGHNPHVSAVSPPHSISPRRRGTLTVPSPTLGFLGDSTDTLEIPVLGSIALSKAHSPPRSLSPRFAAAHAATPNPLLEAEEVDQTVRSGTHPLAPRPPQSPPSLSPSGRHQGLRRGASISPSTDLAFASIAAEQAPLDSLTPLRTPIVPSIRSPSAHRRGLLSSPTPVLVMPADSSASPSLQTTARPHHLDRPVSPGGPAASSVLFSTPLFDASSSRAGSAKISSGPDLILPHRPQVLPPIGQTAVQLTTSPSCEPRKTSDDLIKTSAPSRPSTGIQSSPKPAETTTTLHQQASTSS
eukprot:m.799689 g.799689  ORF g.799689 m.799689 type:complete len:349 (+) comp59264_c0_seq81:1293-2339(+)